MKCKIHGCDKEPQFLGVCCGERHRRAYMKYAIALVTAMKEGDEIPEPPTAKEVDRIAERANRWTPERMNRRVEELREKINETE